MQVVRNGNTQMAVGRLLTKKAGLRARLRFFNMFLLLVSLASISHAQAIGTGSIAGIVADPSGAVIPNAVVTAVDPATGTTVTQKTSAEGTYNLPSLRPATYRVTAMAESFKTLVRENVTVDALQQVDLNLNLEAGQASETVTVSAEPPQLNTVNGSLDVTIPNTTYAALPLAMNGGPKNPLGFVTLLPGATGGPFGIDNLNGGVGQSSFIYVNGLPLMTPELQGDARNITGSTSTEVVDQFQVITSGVPAYYEGQGLTNFITKSGTNKFHGDVYENIRNTVFDAAGYFSSVTPVEHQNEFGATVGGPILKNRLFFFFNYDGYRFTAGSNPVFSSLPTAAEQMGDFSALTVPIYDPATTACNAAGVCTRQAFAGNKIPANRVSTVSQSLAGYLPTPLNGNIQNNFLNALTGGTNQNTFIGKADYTLTKNNHVLFLAQWGHVTQPSLGNNGGPQLPLPYTSSRFFSQKIELYQLEDTETITQRLVNTAGFQVNRFLTPFTNPTTQGNYASKAGLTGLPTAGQATQNFPPVTFSGPDAPTNWAQDFNSQTFSQVATSTLFQDNLQWLKGKHNLTFGGQIVFQAENDSKPSQLDNFGFANTETAGFGSDGGILAATGNAYASYLLGAVDNGSLTDTAVQEFGGRYRDYALYAQDDWKLTPKLTVNLGLRYEIPKPLVEVKNRSSFLNASLPNPAVGGYLGALQFAGDGMDSCHCRTLVQTHYLTLGPRVGFAYSLSPKQVVRASFTIIHYNAGALGGNATSTGSGSEGAVGTPLGFSSNPSFSSPDSGITPAFAWDNGFPAYTHPPFFDPTLNSGYNTAAGANAGMITFTRPTTGGRSPYTENWNLTLERQVSPATSVSLSYAGNNSRFIPINGGVGIYSNQLNPQYLVLGNLLQQQASPATLAQAAAILPGIHLPYGNFVGSIGQMLRPFPQYAGLYDTNAAFGSASYHSFQGYVQHRMSKGLYLLGSYTFSKELDNAGGSNQLSLASASARSAYNLPAEYSVGTNDQTHVISLTYVYELPLGKGHAFGGDGALVNELVGGWQISGLHQYSSGTPLGAIGAVCNVPYTGGCYANFNPAFTGPVRINGKYGSGDPKSGTPYLNVNAFENPAPFTFGNTPPSLVDGLRNPWSLDEDVSVAKRFPIFESVSLKLQADAFNVFNRTIFGGINTNQTSASFGSVSGQANSPRKLQFEAYIYF